MEQNDEVCNAVRVLIARMESHPDDFASVDQYRVMREQPKFSYLSDGLEALARGMARPGEDGQDPFWFLSAVDKRALAEAYTALRVRRFDKQVLDRIFEEEPTYGEGAAPASVRSAYADRLAQSMKAAKNSLTSGLLPNGNAAMSSTATAQMIAAQNAIGTLGQAGLLQSPMVSYEDYQRVMRADDYGTK